MSTAIDVAKILCSRLENLDAYKIQKLVYYTQCWNLVINNVKLFSNRIEAWAAGPVCPDVYEMHRGHYCIVEDMFREGDTTVITDKEMRAIDFVIENYGDYDGLKLAFLSHTEAPWIYARLRANVDDGEACHEEITCDDMRNFYTTFLEARA